MGEPVSASEKRVLFSAMLAAAPAVVKAAMLRHAAKEYREYAGLYEKLIGPNGRIDSEAAATRCEALADEAEKDAVCEARNAAKVARAVEGWFV